MSFNLVGKPQAEQFIHSKGSLKQFKVQWLSTRAWPIRDYGPKEVSCTPMPLVDALCAAAAASSVRLRSASLSASEISKFGKKIFERMTDSGLLNIRPASTL